MSLLRRLIPALLLSLAAGLVWAGDTSVVSQAPQGLHFCVTCHGVDGVGNEAIRAPRLAGLSRWYLRRQLLGFQQGYRGYHEADEAGKEMRPMAEILTPAEIDQVLDWMATWPTAAVVAESAAPQAAGELAASVARGELLYETCSACHGSAAQGLEAAAGPALAGQSGWYLRAQLQKFKQGLRGTQSGDVYGAQMRTMTQMLGDEQAIADVVSYIQTLQQAESEQ